MATTYCVVKNVGQRPNQYGNYEVADSTNTVTLTLADGHLYKWSSGESHTLVIELAKEAVAASSRLSIQSYS